MINKVKNFFKSKSRFYFNINYLDCFLAIVDLLFLNQSKKKYEKKLIKNLNYFYPNSKKYFFSHGRSGFYFLLMNLKNQTKKRKIIINSLTLFEMVNMIIYAGFEPILADNNKGSLETNTIPLIKKNKNDVAAVIITHLNGLNKDIFKVKNFISKFKKNKIFLIEDCAVSLGAKKTTSTLVILEIFVFLALI